MVKRREWLTGMDPTEQAMLGGQRASETCVSTYPVLGAQACPICDHACFVFLFLTWVQVPSTLLCSAEKYSTG